MTNYEALADRYHDQLWTSPAAAYLLERGLAHSTIERFRLGFVGRPAPGHHAFADRLAIPYEDGRGRVRGIRYRAVDLRQPKYLAPKGFNHLFAVRASDHEIVYLTEGEIDAMTLWQLGYRAVGVAGAQAWDDCYRYLFRNCSEIVICFDPDEAGQRGAAKLYRSLSDLHASLRIVSLPEGQDVNDALRSIGEARLRELLDA